MTSTIVTAAVLVIGNEILSGRTHDTNVNFLAKEMTALGIRLKEARVVADDEGEIIAAIDALRAKYDYVFTTGGIGPTHDDITATSVAKAFGVPLIRDPRAVERLQAYYKPEDLNEMRLKMADIPQGADLIDNPVSQAPGFRIGNLFVLAGVPRIMQAMIAGCRHVLVGGDKLLSKTVTVWCAEGRLAQDLADLQTRMADIEIGSYPFLREDRLGTAVVFRSVDAARLASAISVLQDRLTTQGIDSIVSE